MKTLGIIFIIIALIISATIAFIVDLILGLVVSAFLFGIIGTCFICGSDE